MDKKKLDELKTKVKDKAESALTTAYIFAQNHPILTAVGGTIAGSVVTGVIAHRVGVVEGHKQGIVDWNRAIDFDAREFCFKVTDGDKEFDEETLYEGMPSIAKLAVRQGIRSIAPALEPNKGLLIGRTDDDVIEIVQYERDCNIK